MSNTNWTNDHTKLRNTLAQLYLDRASAQRITTDAGIDPAYITFSDSAINNWHAIITAANHRGLLIRLIEQAISEFPTNTTLKEVLGILKTGSGNSALPPPAISKPITDIQLRDFINEHLNKDEITSLLLDVTEALRQAGKMTSGPNLDIDTFSNISQPTKSIAIALVQFFRRRTWTPYLIAALKAEQPDAFKEKFGE